MRLEAGFMPYIAIEGCIASGKTTLAKALAQEFGIQPMLEDYHDVPSLQLFYEDPGGTRI